MSTPGLVSAVVLDSGDEELDRSLRPRRLDDFVGQERVKEQLAIALAAARSRGEALDHVLLAGPPGLGKTSLAYVIREELGVGIRTVAGPALERKDVAAILTSLEERDVLFIDEIHRLARAAEEMLYPALEDFRIDIVMGQGPAARTLALDLPPFTLVGATTQDRAPDDAAPRPLRHDLPARVLRARRARPHRPPLGADPRRRDRRRGSRRDRPPLARDAAGREPHPAPRARRGGGSARGRGHARRSRTRRSSCSRSTSTGSSAPTARCSRRSSGKFGGGPVGLSTLAVALGEEPDTIEDVYEPYLLQLGFIQRTPRGRIVTELGREHVGGAAAARLTDEVGRLFECLSSGFPARPSPRPRRSSSASTAQIERFAKELPGGEAQVEIELRDGSVLPLESILPEPGFGFVTLRPHAAAKEEIVIPVGAIARLRLGPPEAASAVRLLEAARGVAELQRRNWSSCQDGTGASSSSARSPCGSR